MARRRNPRSYPDFIGASVPTEPRERHFKHAHEKGIGAATVIRWAIEEYLTEAKKGPAA